MMISGPFWGWKLRPTFAFPLTAMICTSGRVTNRTALTEAEPVMENFRTANKFQNLSSGPSPTATIGKAPAPNEFGA